MKFPYLITLAILSLLSCDQNTPTSNCASSEKIPETPKLIQYNHCTDLFYSHINYDTTCSCIEEYKLEFPSENVVSGMLYKNCEPEPSGAFTVGETFKLDKQFIDDFRKITADTSNFVWGEPGTPYTDYIIHFYDSTGTVINKAEISYDNYLEAEPLLGTTKWGGVSKKGLLLIQDLINKYN